MKKTLLLIFVLPFLSSFSQKANGELPTAICKDKEIASNGYQIKTVVLDAGHGGKDAGCSGKKSKEKHIALNIVLKLGKAIEDQFPHINVIYTRKTDVFVPLHERAALANKNDADLFISIHCNALSRKAHLVQGSETYVMGLHTADHNLEVARRENEAILLEENYQKNYQGFDPNSDEGHIFLTLFQNAYLDKSIQFAEKIEAKIKAKAKRRSRGVKQAGFVVLKETTMPSVLIETGYLTHSSEEAFLATDCGQNKIARSIFEAFAEYKQEVEEQSVEPIHPIATQTAPTTIRTSTNYAANPIVHQAPKQETKKISSAAPKAVPTNLQKAAYFSKNSPTINSEAKPTDAVIIFKIQLAASPSEIETSNKKWSKIQFVEVRKEKNLYKYLTGSHSSYEAAVKDRNDVLAKGFNGAFIVAYQNGERISLKIAKKQ